MVDEDGAQTRDGKGIQVEIRLQVFQFVRHDGWRGKRDGFAGEKLILKLAGNTNWSGSVGVK